MKQYSGRSNRVYLYVLAHDTGYAPNPFHGYCTLACCKPSIRRTARVGDWIIGLTPRKIGNRLAYAMKVNEVLSFDEYWKDERFEKKKPNWKSGIKQDEYGDNCYQPLSNGRYRQMKSQHHDPKTDCGKTDHIQRDLSGVNVLVSYPNNFIYFGGEARIIPYELQIPKVGIGHRVIEIKQNTALLRYLNELPRGVNGDPRAWESEKGSQRNRTQRKC